MLDVSVVALSPRRPFALVVELVKQRKEFAHPSNLGGGEVEQALRKLNSSFVDRPDFFVFKRRGGGVT